MCAWTSTRPGRSETSPRSWTRWVAPTSGGSSRCGTHGPDPLAFGQDRVVGQPARHGRIRDSPRLEHGALRHDGLPGWRRRRRRQRRQPTFADARVKIARRSDEGRQQRRRPRASRPCRRGRASRSCRRRPPSRWPARWRGRPAACPRCSSSMAPVQIWAIGLAIPFPAMSGAEPCTGSNIDGCSFSGLMLPPGARPIDPAMAGPRSERMSPKRFGPDHHVEPVRVLDEVGGEDVDVVLRGLDVRILLRHRGEALVPVRHAVDDAVRLGRRGDVAPLPRPGQLERVAHDAVRSPSA